MQHMIETLRVMSAVLAGGVIGIAFGLLQEKARLRYEQKQQRGELKSEFNVMSGSMRRVASLMIALVLVQVICPLLFRDGTQWLVSGGVVVGYGILLYRRFKILKTH
jgi:hypothetical protein